MARTFVPEIVTAETVTPEWLNAKLGITTIESINVQRIGEDIGHTDLVYRLHLTHRHVEFAGYTKDKPHTLVLKVMDASSGHRTAFEVLNTREVRFYSEIAPLLDLASIPTCYHAYFDKETQKGNMLLEDAGKAIHKGNFSVATPAQAKKTMTELGRFHGASIANLSKIPTDLPRPNEPSGEELREAFTSFAETWRPFLGEEALNRYSRAIDAYEKKWLVEKDSFVQGLVHGDYRIGNVIFGRDEGSKAKVQEPAQQDDDRDFAESVKASIAHRHAAKPAPETETETETGMPKASPEAPSSSSSNMQQTNGTDAHINGTSPPHTQTPSLQADDKPPPSISDDTTTTSTPLKFLTVDYQTVSRGPIFYDVAYFLSISLTPSVRQRHEFDLVHDWYTACRAAAGDAFPAHLTISKCVHGISVAAVKAALISVTTLNHMRAPDVVMRMLAGKLGMVVGMLEDWGSLE